MGDARVHRGVRKSVRGMVYIISLTIAMLLTMTGGSLLMRSVSELGQSEQSRNESEALHLADAGVDQAKQNLRTPTDTTDDITAAAFSTGSFQIETPVPLGGNAWSVKTHGTSAQNAAIQRHIEAVFQLTPASVFQFALFADKQLNVSGSAITDSYDSRLGPYHDGAGPTHNAGHNGDVGTNATTAASIAVGGSIFIDGQVAVGPNVLNPESVVTGYDPSFITGGTSPPTDTQDVVSESNTFPMPAVIVPGGLTCTDFTVGGNSTVTLTPGVYCYNNLTIQGGGELTASGAGAVTVYLTGALIARGNSTIGVANDPTRMLFLMSSTGQAVIEEGTITGSTEFYGGLYGPSATINISGNAEVYGSITANTINLSGSASIHYDEALTTVTSVSNLFTTKLVSWRETTS